MVDLERARGPAPARERPARLRTRCARRSSTTPSSGRRRGTGTSSATTCSRSRSRSGTFGLKPMNCPGHCVALLAGARAATASCRSASPRRATSTATSSRASLHGLLRVRHFVQDDAHIFCTREQIEDEVLGCLDYAFYLYELLGLSRCASSSRPGRRSGSAPTRSGTRPRPRSTSALAGRASSTAVNEGDGAFYGPKIDLHMLGRARPQLAARHGPARLPDAAALRARATRAPTTPSTRR